MRDSDRESASRSGESPKRVVVVGGGFAGRRLQKLLLNSNAAVEVTLVDAKGYFEYTPSSLRCLVEPSLAERTVIPQPEGTVIGCVTGIALERDDSSQGTIVRGVRLASGVTLQCDVAVLATGSSYAAPVKGDQLASSCAEQRREELAEVAAHIAAAARVCVVGGGAVGVELAAEICHKFGPRKRVTLIASQPRLLDRMAPGCFTYAATWLASRGVEVILGQRVTDWGGADAAGGRWGVPGAYRLVTSGGDAVTADLVFGCAGARNHPGGGWEGLPLSPSGGGIQVLETLQVAGIPNLYAIGDAADTRVEKTALSADLSAALAARNILSSLSRGPGRPLLSTLAAFSFPQGVCHGATFVPDIQAVSLGPASGTMQFNSLVINGRLVGWAKALIEWLQVGTAAGRWLHTALWAFLEATSVFAVTHLFVTAAQRTKAPLAAAAAAERAASEPAGGADRPLR